MTNEDQNREAIATFKIFQDDGLKELAVIIDALMYTENNAPQHDETRIERREVIKKMFQAFIMSLTEKNYLTKENYDPEKNFILLDSRKGVVGVFTQTSTDIQKDIAAAKKTMCDCIVCRAAHKRGYDTKNLTEGQKKELRDEVAAFLRRSGAETTAKIVEGTSVDTLFSGDGNKFFQETGFAPPGLKDIIH